MIRITRPTWALLASMLTGLVAVVVAARWVGEQTQLATAPVVVAARDLGAGTRLTPDMLRTIDWPAGARPDHSSAQADALAGRVLTHALMRGEPVLDARLAPQGERGGLSALLAEGRRAMTVKVSEIVGVAGFALPGHYVDMMVNTQDALSRPTSKIVLERILVLAVAQDASAPDNKPRVVNAVTLEVTPEQAEQIDLARNVGAISLVLRNQADTARVVTTGVRKDTLLGDGVLASTGLVAGPAAKTEATGRATAARAAHRTSASRTARAGERPNDRALDRNPASPASRPAEWTVQVIRGVQASPVSVPLPASVPHSGTPTP
ncbi:MAG: Flp pilus assembly protein CpaB [Burkholderiaceae bacterium]